MHSPILRRLDDGDWAMIPLYDYFDARLHLGQNGVEVPGEFCFRDADRHASSIIPLDACAQACGGWSS
jgi:hypothetical protein